MYKKDDPIFSTLEIGRHHFPGMWQYLLPEEFKWIKPPRELTADCSRCIKVARGEHDAECQCCTYFPQVPNYMVGLALMDPGSCHPVKNAVEKGCGLPRDLVVSPLVFKRTVEGYTKDLFGRAKSIVCPF